MPSRDSTGPRGNGPRTGRGLGVCKPKLDEEGNPIEPEWQRGTGQGRGRRGFDESSDRGFGRGGGGRGRGGGRGFGRGR